MTIIQKPEISLIADDESLRSLCAQLASSIEFSFDTEYDSFKRSYGFNLLLMQICDGTQVYVIDPLAIKDLSSLKAVMENRNITKLVYAGSEDVALMKQYDIHIQGVFDVQIAATLCNHPARNLGNLILEEFGITIDKKLQKSDWSIRPLSKAQMLYVANDVIFLETLRNNLLPQVNERNLTYVLDEENSLLEEVSIRQHIPELSGFYYKTYTKSYCDALMELLLVRDELARKINIPPDWVISKANLENALMAQSITNESAWPLFHHRIRSHEGWKKQILQAAAKFDPLDDRRGRSPNYVKRSPDQPILTPSQKEQLVKFQFEPIFREYIETYGELCGEYLLRNLKRIIKGEFKSDEPSRKYQQPILDRMRAMPIENH